MKLLRDSLNPSRSNNGGSYATGYQIVESEFGCTVIVDRCFGSDYEGEYLHEYDLPLSIEQAEKLVIDNPDAFSNQCAHGRIAILLEQLAA